MQPAAIETLIPHRPPMQLLDRVLAWDEAQLWAQVAIDSTSPFVDAGQVSAVVGLEYLAQASAAFFTLAATPGDTPRAGMLIACSNFSATAPFFAAPGYLAAHIRLASTLPRAGHAASLVKFTGTIFAIPEAMPAQLHGSTVSQLVTTPLVDANFSVYV